MDLLPDETELLERHVLARPDDAVDPTLERFRASHAPLVRVTDRMLSFFRIQVRGEPADTERSLAAVKQRLGLSQPGRVMPTMTGGDGLRARGISGVARPTSPSNKAWYTLGAAMAGVALLMVGWVLGRTGRHARAEVTYTTYATANGERANITLPDGNTVVLGVASRLEVPTNYGAGNHTVRLPVGMALFSVSHHAGAPFTVRVGHTMARVLGTSFTIRHYPADTYTTVAVRDGKVSVGRTVVTARQLVAVGRGGESRVRPADASWFSFASGVLMLDSMPLSDAIPELNRWYNADIRLGDPALASQMVEGNFTAGSLADLAAVLEWTFQVRVVRDGRVVTLYPKRK